MHLLFIGFVLSGCTAPGGGYRGLPATRTQNPVELTVLDLLPRRAQVLPAGKVLLRTQLALTNQILFNRTAEVEPFVFDGEIYRFGLQARMGLGNNLDLEILPAATLAGPGFLDQPVDEYHNTFGFPEGLRSNVRPDQYAMQLAKEGGLIFRLERDELIFADLPLTLSWQAATEDEEWWQPAVLARVATEVPLGDYQRGTGNDGWDVGAGLAATKRYGWSQVTGTISFVVPHTPDRVERQGGEYRPRISASLGAEMPVTERVSLLAQLQSHQSVLAGMKAGRLRRIHLILWTGGRIDLGEGYFAELLLGEGLTQKLSPDFTFLFALGTVF